MLNLPIKFYLPNLLEGGAQYVIAKVANEMARMGHDVTIIVNQGGDRQEFEISNAVKLEILGASNMITAVPKLYRYMKSAEPPVIVAAMTHANLPVLVARLLSRASTRIIISERHATRQWLRGRRWSRRVLYGRLISWIYPLADGVIAVSKGVKQDLLKATDIEEDRISVVYNPSFPRTAGDGSQDNVLHPWLRDKTRPVLIGAGRLEKQKDFATLLQAFALLRETHQARLLIFGEGSQREKLESLVRKLDVVDDVSLPGYIDDLYMSLSEASLFVLSSRYEGFPNILIEALASGVPIVSTDCEYGPSEVIINEQIGRLVPVGDPEKLAEAIRGVLDDPPAKEARLRRVSEFTLSKTVNGYLSFIHQVGSREAPLAFEDDRQNHG